MNYTEFLSKIRRKNKAGGSEFFLLDADEINFDYQPTVRYMPGSIITYNQNFYLRNTRMTGYNAGILPTDPTFWIPADLGRDLGHHTTQAALETAHPTPAEGSFASVGDASDFLLYGNGIWNPIGDDKVKKVTTFNPYLKKLHNIAFHSNDAAVGYDGALKITFPHSWPDVITTFSFKLSGYSYDYNDTFYNGAPEQEAWSVQIGGIVTDSSSANWVYTNVVATGNTPFDTVRFGHDGAKLCIWLGEAAPPRTRWEYAYLALDEILIGSKGTTAFTWEEGWAMSIITSTVGYITKATETGFLKAADLKKAVVNTRKDLVVNFNSDLDTVSSPILFKGAIANLVMDLPYALTAYSFEAKLDSAVSTYTALADVVALESWINTNVTTNTTKWHLRIIVSYAAGETGETSANFSYEKIKR